ncbi:hypothetical protein SteCoe_12120 [Stentor coeruleus]|uniref:Guanylate cyclase domain-containing protein n=1 Tax=Stentor coeruleus TaxID=5963 RepID=A0A1R2CBL5_9CILI|nr:hypothetical protein SteCoe_12120 [Stentor coeruleus]
MQDGSLTRTVDRTGKVHKEEMSILSSTVPQMTVISGENHSSDSNVEHIPIRYRMTLSEKINKFLNSNIVTITLNIATIYALFGDDIKTLGFAKSSDDGFSSLVVICLFLFSLELTLSFIFKPDYKWSFYFWLDLIATVSLITDISWIWESALGLSSGSSNSKSLQNAGKASRAGTRSTRALRIIRIVRLIRIVKLYKNAKTAMKNREMRKNEEDEIIRDMPEVQESKVGKRMSEVTMKRVIIIVLALLFILPLFETDFYYTSQTSWEFGLTELNTFLNQDGFDYAMDEYWSYHESDNRPIVYLQYTTGDGVQHNISSNATNYNDLRFSEIFYASSGNLISIFDLRYDVKLTSLLNVCRTIFICIVLTLGSIYFTKDSEDLVIKPIEKMIEKVKIIAKNPIAAAEIQEMSNKREEEENSQNKKCFGLCKAETKKRDYETKLLENTILKIGVLLALGFGEAGSLIIGGNVEAGGDVDPMANGNKVIGIYGFCDIRNFTDTTEELQEGVMMFVNEIAQIVHGLVDKYLGAANKNIGDAFLLVWKFQKDELFLNEEDKIVRNPSSKRAHYLPDVTMISFLKIMAKVNKDPAILKYRTNQKLLQRMPNYEVKMGFGMHLGWAIEGAIGSQFKIDASYLSPNVNVASALEGSTKIYGVPLLISGPLYESFSEPIQRYCRHIDTIVLKGNAKPLKLYTSDCDFTDFTPSRSADRSKMYFRKKRRTLKKGLEKQEFTTADIYSRSKEIALMRKPYTREFFDFFSKGMNNYLSGMWQMSKNQLEKVLAIRNRDGPTLSLMSFMSETAYRAPAHWKGSRYLG